MPGVRLPIDSCNECPFCQPYQNQGGFLDAECQKGHYKVEDKFDFQNDVHGKCMFKRVQGARTSRTPMPSSR